MAEINFFNFKHRVERSPRNGQRKGQFAFNELFKVRPDLSEQVRATDMDPFYQDDILPLFWQWVEQNWSVSDAKV